MDLSTMHAKAREGQYRSTQAVRDDFELMCLNAIRFNRAGLWRCLERDLELGNAVMASHDAVDVIARWRRRGTRPAAAPIHAVFTSERESAPPRDRVVKMHHTGDKIWKEAARFFAEVSQMFEELVTYEVRDDQEIEHCTSVLSASGSESPREEGPLR